MVKGLDRFREYFAGHEDGYTLIGGCLRYPFRRSRTSVSSHQNFDIVLCVEVVSVEFGTVFADFLEGRRISGQGTLDRQAGILPLSSPC